MRCTNTIDEFDCVVSLKVTEAACVPRTHMTRTTRKLMKSITTLMREWTRSEEIGARNDSKKNWNVTVRRDPRFNSSSQTWRYVVCQERPKIQQQFSDLKVCCLSGETQDSTAVLRLEGMLSRVSFVDRRYPDVSCVVDVSLLLTTIVLRCIVLATAGWTVCAFTVGIFRWQKGLSIVLLWDGFNTSIGFQAEEY